MHVLFANGQIVLDPAIYITVLSIILGGIGAMFEHLWSAYRGALKEIDRLNLEIRESVLPLLEGVSSILHEIVRTQTDNTTAQTALRESIDRLTGGINAFLQTRPDDRTDDRHAPPT